MSPRRGIVFSLSLTLGAAALAWLPTAHARDDDPPRGDCGRSDSDYRLRFVGGADNGRFTVIGVVFSDDQNLWEWRMRHNGELSAKGEVRARDAERSLRIERTMIDYPGPDTVVFRAENLATGEVCRAVRDF